MEQLTDIFNKLYQMTAFSNIIADPSFLIMYALAFVLLYLGIVKKYEPLLLVPIAFGVLLWPTAAKPTSGKCRCTTSPMNSA
jgi:oxaloacetate decarboxylase beta subunit